VKVHRSRRQGILERSVLGTVGFYPYRCSICKARFWKASNPATARRRSIWNDPPPWLTAILWGLVAAAIGVVIVGIVAFRDSL